MLASTHGQGWTGMLVAMVLISAASMGCAMSSGPEDTTGPRPDSGVRPDSGPRPDGGTPLADAGTPDTGTTPDGSAPDAGTPDADPLAASGDWAITGTWDISSPIGGDRTLGVVASDLFV